MAATLQVGLNVMLPDGKNINRKTCPLFPRVKLDNRACLTYNYQTLPFLDTIGTFIVQFHHRKITRSI